MLKRTAITAPVQPPDLPTPGARLVRLEDGRLGEVIDETRQPTTGYRPGLQILNIEPLEGRDRHPRWLPECRVTPEGQEGAQEPI